MSIKNWSTTPASNNSASPNGFPEGMAPSGVNDAARQVMADVRSQMEDAEWFNWGDAPSRASAATFKIPTDVTTRYAVNRRIKCYDGSTFYGVITASAYSAPDTLVTVGLDSGALTSSLSGIALAILSPTNLSVPSTIGRKGADIASATTTDLSTVTGDFVDITGTTTITGFGTLASGVMRTVRFTGALTLTHNGTSLILPNAANITTANGDTAILRSLGSGNWVCIAYTRTNGLPIVTGSKGADIASATTTDIGAATGDFVDVTGTTTITGLGTTGSGVVRTVRFTGALILTHNATSLILPGAVNITTANGDTAIFRSLGSGNWVCITYFKADGGNLVIYRKGADLASAATTDLATATGDFVDVTGTTPITALGTLAEGIQKTVRFTGALTLTHNATSLILSGAANITTANGDIAVFRSLGSGNWVCVNYQRGITIPGVLVQQVGNQTGAVATGATATEWNDSIPQNTEGNEYLTQAITPKSALSILEIDVVVMLASNGAANLTVALFQDTTANALAAMASRTIAAGNQHNVKFTHRMVAGTTSATTFKVRIGPDAAVTVTFNGTGSARIYGGVAASSITIKEYAA